MSTLNWTVVSLVVQMMSGDRNGDGQLSRDEFVAHRESWFDSLDSAKTGRIPEADFHACTCRNRHPRADGDYALSWIRREGKGRVFYEAHGHNEKVYANAPLLTHILAGMQYVLGDLPADDAPSARSATR
jgi:type 1 glutamine amidotransferase